MREYFHVNVSKYDTNKNFELVRPASLNNPKDNAVMFVVAKHVAEADTLLKVENCLVFWPMDLDAPEDVAKRHVILQVDNPRLSYSKFFIENNIKNLPLPSQFDMIGGAYVERGAMIGSNCVIYPDVYIGKDVTIGDGVYIGSGVKLMGEIVIGDNVVIRDNTVIGADGLTTNRGADGKAVTMPQFGGVWIGNDVQIGANVVIARGAIDNTEICRGAKIDSCTFISHNAIVGEDTFIVGETIMFGSSSTGSCVLLSGNSSIREGIHIGDGAVVGMGAVVVKPVDNNSVVKGNPAR